MKRLKIYALSALLFCGGLISTACDWGKAERPLNAIGYNIQAALLATGKAVNVLDNCNPNSGGHADFKTSLKKTSQVTEDWSNRIDGLIEINAQTKVELIGLTDGLIVEVGRTLALLKPNDAKIQERVLVALAFAQAAKVAVAAIDTTKPVSAKDVKAKLKDAADKSLKAGTRDATQTICVVDGLGVVVSDYTADILAQKGLDAAALRDLRKVKFNAVQALQ